MITFIPYFSIGAVQKNIYSYLNLYVITLSGNISYVCVAYNAFHFYLIFSIHHDCGTSYEQPYNKSSALSNTYCTVWVYFKRTTVTHVEIASGFVITTEYI